MFASVVGLLQLLVVVVVKVVVVVVMVMCMSDGADDVSWSAAIQAQGMEGPDLGCLSLFFAS